MYTSMKYSVIGKTGSGQDGAIWGDRLFRFNAKGECRVFSLPDFAQVSDFTLDKVEFFCPHSNAVCFGSQRWDEKDEYPLLYSNLYNNYASADDRREGVCCVYRLTRDGETYSTTLVQILRIGFVNDLSLWKSMEGKGDVRPYGNFVVDAGAQKLHAFVMRDADQVTRYFTFRLPDKDEGTLCRTCGARVVTLEKQDILSWFDGPYSRYIQGACCRDGLIYSTEGFIYKDETSPNPPRIQIVDVNRQQPVADLALYKLGIYDEAEFIDWYEDKLWYSDAHGTFFAVDELI